MASGLPLFFPKDKLVNENDGYLKDNCLFLKIIVGQE